MKNRRLIFQTYQEIEKFKNVLNDSGNGVGEKVLGISDLENQVVSSACKIAVVGEFKRGKSSFINAVLGEKILPEAVAPWTAVQTEIVFDETETAYIWTESDQKMKVAREALEGWLTKSNKQEKKAKKARIGFPSSFLLDNEVILVDTPGLNDHEDLDMRTFDMVRDTDILIWMLSNSSPFSATEMNYIIDLVRNSKVSNVFFVMNKIDIVEDEDREILLQTVIRRINEMTIELPERKKFFFGDTTPVFGFSAKYALNARKQQDSELLWESGLPMLQEKLEEMIQDVCWRKKTVEVLKALSQQIENEISICDEKILQWDRRANELDGCSEYISSLNNFFGDSIIEHAKIIGSNCKRQLKSCEKEIQSKFQKNVYARGYSVLNDCCIEANNWGNKYRDTLLPTVTAALLPLYHNKKTEFLLNISSVCEKSKLEIVYDSLEDENVLSLDSYFPKFYFEIFNFPGLLIKRNSYERQIYIDRIVSQKLEWIADKWEKDCSTWALSVIQKMNVRCNELIQSLNMSFVKHSQECTDNISHMTDSMFYNGLKAVLEEVNQLKNCAEGDLL